MLIRSATLLDLGSWVELRTQLWSHASSDRHRKDAAELLLKPENEGAAFVAADHEGIVLAFAEAVLRHDYVNGCKTSPVAFLEGIYVRPENRSYGLGKRLLIAVESWARMQRCKELASDALLDSVKSQDFHAAVGFEETERVVYFRKLL